MSHSYGQCSSWVPHSYDNARGSWVLVLFQSRGTYLHLTLDSSILGSMGQAFTLALDASFVRHELETEPQTPLRFFTLAGHVGRDYCMYCHWVRTSFSLEKGNSLKTVPGRHHGERKRSLENWTIDMGPRLECTYITSKSRQTS